MKTKLISYMKSMKYIKIGVSRSTNICEHKKTCANLVYGPGRMRKVASFHFKPYIKYFVKKAK